MDKDQVLKWLMRERHYVQASILHMGACLLRQALEKKANDIERTEDYDDEEAEQMWNEEVERLRAAGTALDTAIPALEEAFELLGAP